MITYSVEFVLKDGTRIYSEGFTFQDVKRMQDDLNSETKWFEVELGEGKPIAIFPARNISAVYIDQEKE